MKKIGKFIIIFTVIFSCSYYLVLFNEELQNQKQFNYVIKKDNQELTFNEEDNYILSVLACEMPASYSEEALKAQAVAARTFAMYRMKVEHAKKLTKNDQCYLDEEMMKEKWKNSYNKYYNKLKQVVIDTKDEIIFKDEKPIKTFYFSTSNGYTESSKTIFNKNFSDSVSSIWDKDSKDYLKEVKFTKDELVTKLGNFKNIKIKKRNKTNHVEMILVDNKEMSGIDFRKKLNLRSTDFDIIIKDNNYIITTRGYGHGVGMSQYGANYLAKKGHNYQEILNYYYGNIDIQKINV